jgi:hypothetical protein
VDTVGALELRAVTDGSAELDKGGLGLRLLGLGDGIVDGCKVTGRSK